MDILFYILFFSLLMIYILFLSGVVKGISKIQLTKSGGIPDEYVTVIIPFRNESANILNSLRSITGQDYPSDKYEVVYINDCSEDDSLQKICTADKPGNIKVLSFQNMSTKLANKKQAVQFAINNSRGEIIVTTDCDCYHGPQWLRTVLSYYEKNTAFISGPVCFKHDESTFQQIQQLEFGGLILAGAGLIGMKKPVICNAANLTFRKNAFKEVNGYYDNLHLSSGDDEFLMRKIATLTNYDIKFAFNKNATVFTYANKNLEQFYEQRKRWASKSLFYNKLLLVSLLTIFLFFLSIPAQLVLGIFLSSKFLLSLFIVLTGKMLMEYIVLKRGSGIVLDQIKTKYFIYAELLHIPYIIIAAISGVFGNFEWKNRKLKR